MGGSSATSSGYRSITFTTQSESVPLVDAMRLTTGWPLILTAVVRVSDTYARTSGRPEASRWSSTSHSDQVRPLGMSYPVGRVGRARYGTGFAGSDTCLL